MSLIVIIGNATLDIINHVDQYPAEDSEVRINQQRMNVGGNAANTAIVLAQHQHICEWVGVLADDADGFRIRELLQQHNIDLHHTELQAGHSPISYITHNQSTGSRTICHYRNLPELSAHTLQRLDPERYDWLHFEGRNISVLQQVLPTMRAKLFDQTVSLEVEKPRTNIESLFPYADVLMFSTPYRQAQGYNDSESFLQAMQEQHPDIIMTCTQGEHGAWLAHQGDIFHQAAPEILASVDTVAAGDTFNAGLIHALAIGRNPQEALKYAVHIASRKIQQTGLAGLTH